MKNCPICNDPLINEYYTTLKSGGEVHKQTCCKRISHAWSETIFSNNVMSKYNLIQLVISDRNIICTWYCNKQEFFINQQQFTYLPPDFSDFKKLKNKVNTMLTFY